MRARERAVDRRVTAAGLWVAGGFLALAVASAALPANLRMGTWLPLHLALAGAASQAIGATLPFFTASLLAGRPARWELRAAVQVCLALGALGVTAGVALQAPALAATGGTSFVAGIGLLAVAAFLPLRRALGRRHPWVLAAYAVALADVAAGAFLGTLEVAGVVSVQSDWSWLEPAHAWLNLLGFVSLVVAGTMLHLYPTVVGAKLGSGRAMRAMVLGLALGAPLIALGYAARQDLVGRSGAGAEIVGAFGLVAYVVAAWRSRGRWTGELAWRTVSIASLGSSVAWFAVAVAVSAGRVLALGPVPVAWSLAPIGAPLAAGWMAQSVIGAWTHLLPAISGGSPRRHSRQRAVLGLAAVPRVVALNCGVALLTGGMTLSAPDLVAAGAFVVAMMLAVGLGLLLAASLAPEPGSDEPQASRTGG